jgi:hypothetical protein
MILAKRDFMQQLTHAFKDVYGERGYSIVDFSKDDFQKIHQIIELHWLKKLSTHYPNEFERFKKLGLKSYHQHADSIDHSDFWCKKMRILSKEDAGTFRNLQFFQAMEKVTGGIGITNEAGSGYDEFYWRICRPNMKQDIGPLHADEWFWELNNYRPSPVGKDKVKLWIGVETEPGLNGLRVVPGSHLKKWDYKSSFKYGSYKPEFDDTNVDAILLDIKPGQGVLFNHHLLHGGALNKGKHTRVSIECTICIDKNKLNQSN